MIKCGQQYVKVNTAFVKHELSAAAVKVMFLFASIAQAANSEVITVSNSHIAERTGLTNITRIINELFAIGAVKERVERFKNNHRKCNSYILSDVLVNPDNYKFVPISALELPKSALRLLMIYTLNCNQRGRCLMSLAQLQEASGMARGTVVSCTKELQEYGYIAKQRYQTYEGDYGHNRVYVTHIIRRSHSMRAAEALRVIINGITADYSEKCAIEKVLNADRETAFEMICKEIKLLFRSTKVARFLRRLFLKIRRKIAADFFIKIGRSRKMTKRFIYLFPALLI